MTDCQIIGIGIGNIVVNISDSNCDHRSCVEDESLSNCYTRCGFDDETHFSCSTCLVKDKSIRLDGMNSNSISLFIDLDHMCQPLCLGSDSFGFHSAQDYTFENLKSSSGPTVYIQFDVHKIGLFWQTDWVML